MDTRKDYWLVLLLLSNILVAMAVFKEWPLPLRGYVVFGYLLFCPGLALAFIIPSKDILTRLFLVIVLSVGIDTVAAEIILYMGRWSPELILVILMVVSLAGMLLELYFKIRQVKLLNNS